MRSSPRSTRRPAPVPPDAERRQGIVPPAAERFVNIAGQQANEVLGAEPLSGAQDRRHHLLRLDGAFEHFEAVHAQVAVPAWCGCLAEVGEQRLPTAAGCLAQCQERVEPPAFDALSLLRRIALLDLHPPQAHVVEAVERERVGGQTVAPGAPISW
jgi:hypothetical protein